MKIKELDVVRLKDGREGVVVHIYEGQQAVEVEFEELIDSDHLNIATISISDVQAVI